MTKPFFRFTVGWPGSTVRFVRYISDANAVRDGCRGVFCYQVPLAGEQYTGMVDTVALATSPEAAYYSSIRAQLIHHAWMRELIERRTARTSARAVRTHYRLTMSFEAETTTEAAFALVYAWLTERLPQASAVGFMHRNTAHAHVHLWLDARGLDGKMLHFSHQEYRTLHASWTRLYERHMELSLAAEKQRAQMELDLTGSPFPERDR